MIPKVPTPAARLTAAELAQLPAPPDEPITDWTTASSFAFPAGTVSGAPKIRAMQIIAEIEPQKRSLYGGAIGYFGYNGNLDTCIVIRTIVMKGKRLYINAGAGIVADSVPQREYEESLNKAQALVRAAEIART